MNRKPKGVKTKKFQRDKTQQKFAQARFKKRDLDNKEIEKIQSLYNEIDLSSVQSFKDLPLSFRTQKGLAENDYNVPTEIQRECIGLALRGFDILGAAKTGSGKTLAFLIPVLEKLYCNKWTSLDGVGALVITPTRELALQIYETLRKVGKYHDFSAGLIIGGKDLHFEKNRMHQINIVICTPGRLLQHMDENPLFSCSNLKILILDEADRCLDLGFEKSMNAIIENLPPVRQTLLFSATQTKRVKDLIRLSLKDPKYVSVHENSRFKTPEGLRQSVVFCDQHEKMPMIWSFIKTHSKHKIIVFMSTCHQVRYIYEIFNRLHPRVTLLALHGKIHQLKRIEIYRKFCTKQFAVLFATDLAARGLDFPRVNWVVQLDCPENVETYIHRAGRTARYEKGGECLLVLRPSEKIMLNYLQENRIPIEEIKINPSRLFSPQAKIEAHLAMSSELKECAQRAFVAYAKSVFLMKDKTVFDVKTIDCEKYSRSLGLVVSPRIRFLKKLEKTQNKNKLEGNTEDKSESDNPPSDGSGVEDAEESEIEEDSNNEEDTKKDDVEKKTNLRGSFKFYSDSNSDSEDDVLTLKRRHEVIEDDGTELELQPRKKKQEKVITKAALAKRIIKKKITINKKILFTEEGEVMMNLMKERVTEAGKNYESNLSEGGIDIDEAKQVMREEDKWDKKLFREKIKARRREMKRKLKEERMKGLKSSYEEPDEDGVKLGGESEGSEPDLSWLPDPDVIYGKKADSDGDDNDDEDRSQENKKTFDLDDDDDSNSGIGLGESDLTIKEQEELALKLLSKK